MYKEDLYDGGVAAPVPVGEVPVARDLVSGPLAEGMARVAANAQRAMVTGVQMEDSRREFAAKRDLMALESEVRMDVERRLHLPDGHAEALFDKQGNFREVEWENMRGRVERRLEGVGAAILDPVRRQEVQAAAGLTGARLLDGLAESWQKVQQQKLEGDWKDAYDLAVAEGRIGDAMALVDRGAQMGLFTANRGKVMKVGLRGKGLRAALKSAREGGADAAELTLAKMLDGEAESVLHKDAEDGGLALTMDEKRMRLLANDSEQLTLNESMINDVAGGDVLSPEEFCDELIECTAGSLRVEPGDFKSGSVVSGAAPAAARKVVQQANMNGGWTRERYKEAIYALGGELITNPLYKGLTDEKMRELLFKTVFIPGMGEQVFSGELVPEAANEAMVREHVDNLMSLRDGGIKQRVRDAVAGGRGMDAVELSEDDGCAEYATMMACEAVGRYRRQGGTNWYEEQELIAQTVEDAKNEYEEKGGEKAWSEFRDSQNAVDLLNTKAYQEKTGVWKDKVKNEQKAAEEKEESAKKKPKVKTKEEKLRESPYLGRVEVKFKHKANNEKRATLTVPKSEYEAMMQQYECGDRDILLCTLNGKKTELLVLPGDDDSWTVNTAGAVLLMPGKKKEELERYRAALADGMSASMELSRITVVGNK